MIANIMKTQILIKSSMISQIYKDSIDSIYKNWSVYGTKKWI